MCPPLPVMMCLIWGLFVFTRTQPTALSLCLSLVFESVYGLHVHVHVHVSPDNCIFVLVLIYCVGGVMNLILVFWIRRLLIFSLPLFSSLPPCSSLSCFPSLSPSFLPLPPYLPLPPFLSLSLSFPLSLQRPAIMGRRATMDSRSKTPETVSL